MLRTFFIFVELLYNSDMTKNIKLICNLTSDFRYVSEELYNKLVAQYGGEDKLLKFYVKKEISLLIKRGSRIIDISVLHNFDYDREKEDYYNELVKFHSDNGLVKFERKESRTNFIETDEDVKGFINRWKQVNNNDE